MAGYTIGSDKGKQIAGGMRSGDTYKAADGSTWKKNANGTVSVTTKQGGYTANAYGTPSKSSNAPEKYGSGKTGNTYYDPDTGNVKHISETPEWLTPQPVEQARPEWIGGNTGGYAGGSRDVSGTGLSQDYYDRQLKEQQRAIQARIDSAVDQNNAYIPQVNQRSDQSLQNAYILREQNKVNAPQALSARGYTGGATESALLGINTGYENTRNEVEQNRAKSLAEIQQNEAQIRSTGDATLSDAAATYYQNLIASQKEAEAAAQAQANWQAQYDLSEQQYSDAAAQQAWQNAYDEKLLALKNATTAKSSSGSSGGSSGGSSSGSSSNSTNKNSSGNYNTVLTNVKRALGGSNGANTVSWNAAINYIQNSLKSGMITDYEANQMINQLGLN